MRSIAAAGAVLALLLTLNMLVWQQRIFSLPVLLPLLVAGVLGVIWLVLAVAGLAGRHQQEQRSLGAFNAVVSSLVFLGICIVLYAFAERWGTTVDLTEEGRRSLAPQTIQVLQTLTNQVDVTCIFLDVDEELIRIARDKTLRFLEQCQQYTDLLKVTLLDPQVDRAQLEAMNISNVSAQGTVVVAAGARQRTISLSGGSPRLEERDFTNALINVLRRAEPQVYFLQGHNEKGLGDTERDGAAGFVDLLQKESYKVAPLSLTPSDPEVPLDCDLLIINGPQGDLYMNEVMALEAYVNRGGRLLVLLNPLIQPGGTLAPTPNLLSWLYGALGVDVGVDLLVVDIGRPQKLSQVHLTARREPFQELEEPPHDFNGSYNAQHSITRGLFFDVTWTAVRTVGRASKVPEGVVVTDLLRTPPQYWAETDTGRYIQGQGAAELNEGERRGPLPVAVAAVKRLQGPVAEGRPKDARAVVIGDADIMTNAEVSFPGNFNFVFNAIAWLNESEDLIAIRPSGKEDPPIHLSAREQRAVVWVSTLATLQAVLLVGMGVYLLRRRHR